MDFGLALPIEKYITVIEANENIPLNVKSF
jgi:hypothetical protein